MGIFGDLRDPMTEAEIEADIRQRDEEDRAWRAAHPITLKTFAAKLTVSEQEMESPGFKRRMQQMKRWRHAYEEHVTEMALLALNFDREARDNAS